MAITRIRDPLQALADYTEANPNIRRHWRLLLRHSTKVLRALAGEAYSDSYLDVVEESGLDGDGRRWRVYRYPLHAVGADGIQRIGAAPGPPAFDFPAELLAVMCAAEHNLDAIEEGMRAAIRDMPLDTQRQIWRENPQFFAGGTSPAGR
jgi:hypothetical protein